MTTAIPTSPTVTETLEAMIDKHGLLHILTGLSLICAEKAEHIRLNWQDKALARDWDRVAARLDGAVRRAAEMEPDQWLK